MIGSIGPFGSKGEQSDFWSPCPAVQEPSCKMMQTKIAEQEVYEHADSAIPGDLPKKTENALPGKKKQHHKERVKKKS